MKNDTKKILIALAVIVIVVLIVKTFCKTHDSTREKFGPIKSLRQIPPSDCERMCDRIYANVQHTGRGQDPGLAYNRMIACKRTCQYSNFQRVAW